EGRIPALSLVTRPHGRNQRGAAAARKDLRNVRRSWGERLYLLGPEGLESEPLWPDRPAARAPGGYQNERPGIFETPGTPGRVEPGGRGAGVGRRDLAGC